VVLGLEISIEEIDKIIILRLIGSIEASSFLVLQKKLDVLVNEERKNVLLDFSNVDYLSNTGLRVLVSYSNKFKEKKGSLGLFSVNEDIKELIRITGVDKILNIYKNEQEAIVGKNK